MLAVELNRLGATLGLDDIKPARFQVLALHAAGMAVMLVISDPTADRNVENYPCQDGSRDTTDYHRHADSREMIENHGDAEIRETQLRHLSSENFTAQPQDTEPNSREGPRVANGSADRGCKKVGAQPPGQEAGQEKMKSDEWTKSEWANLHLRRGHKIRQKWQIHGRGRI